MFHLKNVTIFIKHYIKKDFLLSVTIKTDYMRAAFELKLRITLLLLLWAAICLTAYSERSSILASKFKPLEEQTERILPEYVMNWEKLND